LIEIIVFAERLLAGTTRTALASAESTIPPLAADTFAPPVAPLVVEPTVVPVLVEVALDVEVLWSWFELKAPPPQPRITTANANNRAK